MAGRWRTPRTGRFIRSAAVVVAGSWLVAACAAGPPASRAPAGGAAGPSPAPSPTPAASPSPSPTPERIDFARQIQPLLEEKCTPCHFPGGRMYDRMPFDRESTVRTLGTAMLTRLRDAEGQDLLRTFLAQPPDEKTPQPAP